MELKERFIDSWRRRRWSAPRVSSVEYYRSVAELPKLIRRRTIAIVRSEGRYKWVAFECPCGYGHRVLLNLDPGRKPSWNLVRERPPTINPSIDVQEARRCHFWIKSGQIQWVPDRRNG